MNRKNKCNVAFSRSCQDHKNIDQHDKNYFLMFKYYSHGIDSFHRVKIRFLSILSGSSQTKSGVESPIWAINNPIYSVQPLTNTSGIEVK